MKLNDKNVASFAVCSSPVDKEGYLSKKGDLNKGYHRRWFVLKGNLLFYFEKKQDKEPLGVIVLEACSVQASSQAKYSFEISFDGQGTRTYVLVADCDEDMQSWLKAISHSSYEYLRSIVDELQRRVNLLTSSSKGEDEAEKVSDMSLLHVGPSKGSAILPTMKEVPPPSSGPKVKVQNGILVDIDEEETPPPIPPKMKGQTIHALRKPVTDLLGSAETSDYDTPPSSTEEMPLLPAKQRVVQYTRTLPSPHSSPVIPPARINPQKPLSPTSTLDRTPFLEPTLVASQERQQQLPPITHSSPSLQSKAESVAAASVIDPPSSQILKGSASSHPPFRKTAAPPDTKKKTIYQMHEEFTQTMNSLRSQRTSAHS